MPNKEVKPKMAKAAGKAASPQGFEALDDSVGNLDLLGGVADAALPSTAKKGVRRVASAVAGGANRLTAGGVGSRKPKKAASGNAFDATEGAQRLHLVKNLLIAVMDDSKLLDTSVYPCTPDYFTDFVLISTGTSSRHVDGAAEKVVKALKQEARIVPIVDKKNKEWIVVDAGFAIVHIMTQENRDKYTIDDLMGDRFDLQGKPSFPF